MTINQSQCPLCKASNHCALADNPNSFKKHAFDCWCKKTPFAPELIAKAQQSGKDKSCICQRCAEQAQQLAKPL